MNETSLFVDNMASTTIAKKDSNEVMLRTKGHDKLFQTAVLSGNMDGSKNILFIVFKGKGSSRCAVTKQLRERNYFGGCLVRQWLDECTTCMSVVRVCIH